MTTRKRLTEQAERLYMRTFDREDLKPNVDRREIALLVDQVANMMLGTEFKQSARINIIEIPTCMIATYEGQTVNSSGSTYSVMLPAFPIRLPMDMGVWSISAEPTGTVFIPIQTDFWDLLGTADEGLLENQVGFYTEGGKIFFTKNPECNTVKIKLLIVDPAQLNEFDPYPISADMEEQVILRVVEILSSRELAPEKAKG